MNRNVTALILIVLAGGIYFTFTSAKVTELRSIQTVNAQYQTAINNAALLIKKRDDLIKADNNISLDDKDRLDKFLPDSVDNVRLIIDVKDNIAASHHLVLKDIQTTSPTDSSGSTNPSTPSTPSTPNTSGTSGGNATSDTIGTVVLSFKVTTDYDTFLSFMRDIESSLRIMDISKLSVTTDPLGQYDFDVSINTYWLQQ